MIRKQELNLIIDDGNFFFFGIIHGSIIKIIENIQYYAPIDSRICFSQDSFDMKRTTTKNKRTILTRPICNRSF